MKTQIFAISLAILSTLHAALPTDEPGATAYLIERGVEITKNADGKAVRLMSGGKESLTPEEYSLIGQLTSLEQIGINGAPLGDGEWGFLKSLPQLKQLAIWHSAGFGTLESFSGLPVESLTVGGCMGLRDKNKTDPEKMRNVIQTLSDLPNLKKGNWYHSPLIPDDSHLAHIAEQFPKLEDLRLDLNAPRGSQTTITPEGLTALQKLPLHTLSLENAHSFTGAHFEAIAGIKSLKALLIDSRKAPAPAEGIAVFQKARPEVQVAVSNPGDTKPPALPKEKK